MVPTPIDPVPHAGRRHKPLLPSPLWSEAADRFCLQIRSVVVHFASEAALNQRALERVGEMACVSVSAFPRNGIAIQTFRSRGSLPQVFQNTLQ